MTRNGKIARLPYDIREELNRRLRDGQFGPALLKWLNELPECKKVLAGEFGPITKQNLSEWRQGGYQEWVRKEEARLQVQRLMEKSGDLEKEAGGMAIADRLGTVLAAELAVAAEQLDEIKDPKERWARLKDITRELYRLRREDHHARKLRMAEEQWEVKSEREKKEYERLEKIAGAERLLKLQLAMKNKPMTASIDGGGDEAWNWTNWRISVAHGLPMPKWWTSPKTAEEWSELMMPYWLSKLPEKGTGPKREAKEPGGKEEDGGLKMEDGKDRPLRDPRAKAKKSTSAASPSRVKSKRARPGPTGSVQKSGPVRPAQSAEERGLRDKDRAEQPSPQSSDAPRALGAPMQAENGLMGDESAFATEASGKKLGAMGSMGNMEERATNGLNESEPVKPSPIKSENEDDSMDNGT